MGRRIIKFSKDESCDKVWFITNVLDNIMSPSAKYGNDYRWMFTKTSGVDKAVEILKREYNLNARKIRSSNFSTKYPSYNIIIRFKNRADEAEFIMRAGEITLDDENGTLYW